MTRLDAAEIEVRSATLTGMRGERAVALPHALDPSDFAPQGGTVQFRLTIDLARVPDAALGIYFNKISQSAELHLNGVNIGPCERGRLPLIRCIHRPYLFVPSPEHWRAGANELLVTLFARNTQVNGLSMAIVDDADNLYRSHYLPNYLLRVALVSALTWANLLLGALALVVWVVLRTRRLYLWFGLTSLSNALVNINVLTTTDLVDPYWPTFLIFAARFVSIPLFVLAMLSFFRDKAPYRLDLALLGYAVAGPFLVMASGLDRQVMTLLYIPSILAAALALFFCVKWALQSRRIDQLLVTALLSGLLVAGTFDWLRFAGHGSLERVFLLPYMYSATLTFVGAILVRQLASALRTSQTLSMTLEARVASRTEDLRAALDRINAIEKTALKLTENIPAGTFVLEALNGRPILSFVSDRFLKILGLERVDALSSFERMLRAVPADDRKELARTVRRSVATGTPWKWSGGYVVDGETRWIEVEASTRQTNDGRWIWEGVIFDATSRKKSEHELLDANKALIVAETEKSRLTERESIVRDMHDGFGSKLAGLRILLSEGQLDHSGLLSILDECISDLYIVVDTLGADDVTLHASVVDFRYRLQGLWPYAGPKLSWRLKVETLPPLPQRTILHIMRLVQEALNNVVKHAEASDIELAFIHDPARHELAIMIADNGVGMPQTPRLGRGISNMKRRAAEIHASVSWAALRPGTRVDIRLDLPPSTTPVEMRHKLS